VAEASSESANGSTSAPKPPAALINYIKQHKCVLFCGAGLSAAANLPTWPALLRAMVTQLKEEDWDNPDLVEVDRMLDAGKLLEVADHCRENLRQGYYNLLTERLRGDTADIPEHHRIIRDLPFAGIVTTNYDKLLERTFLGAARTPTHLDVDSLGPLLFDGSFFILKAHGDVDKPDSIVLTTRDYQNLIHSNAAFNAIFSAILLTKAILFIGYSLNDPDFRLLFDRQLTVFKGHIPPRYALMAGVGRVEREVLLRTAGIRVLPYTAGQHAQVLQFLKELLAQVKSAEAAAPLAVPAPAAAPPERITLMRPLRFKTQGPSKREMAPPTCVVSLSPGTDSLQVSLRWQDQVVEGKGAPPVWPRIAELTRKAFESRNDALLIGRMLTELLPKPAIELLESLPPETNIGLRLSPDVEVLPWEWIIVKDEFLLARNPVVRIPSGISDDARGYPAIGSPVRVLLIGDPNKEDFDGSLPSAHQEVLELQVLYGSHSAHCDCLLGSQATFQALDARCSATGYDVIHFAGHAALDDEPFLLLSGPVKIHPDELRSVVSRRPPAILFLNTHFSIFVAPRARESKGSGERNPFAHGQRGFIEAMSTAGVGTLVGSFSSNLQDAVAKRVGVQFHRELLSGRPVAQALHAARLSAAKQDDPLGVSHLSYSLSGYGDIALPAQKASET